MTHVSKWLTQTASIHQTAYTGILNTTEMQYTPLSLLTELLSSYVQNVKAVLNTQTDTIIGNLRFFLGVSLIQVSLETCTVISS
jgi:hypothetical protein